MCNEGEYYCDECGEPMRAEHVRIRRGDLVHILSSPVETWHIVRWVPTPRRKRSGAVLALGQARQTA